MSAISHERAVEIMDNAYRNGEGGGILITSAGALRIYDAGKYGVFIVRHLESYDDGMMRFSVLISRDRGWLPTSCNADSYFNAAVHVLERDAWQEDE